MKITAIIASGGYGLRMGSDRPKQFIRIKDKPILAYTLSAFGRHADINEIILTSPSGYETISRDIVNQYEINKVSQIVTGGGSRQQTVYNALQAADDTGIIIIHDAVRPFITYNEIQRAINGARAYGACSLGVPVKDTIKQCDKNGFVIQTLPREALWQIQTPQAFSASIIKDAHEQARRDNFTAADDAELTERIGCPTRIIMGSYANIKITTKEDLLFFQ